MQWREIISLGFQHEFFFLFICFYSHLKMHIFLWGAWFLWEKSQIDRWNLHRDVFVLRQRWEIISSGFQNEIFCFIRVWKMVYQQFENANFSLRSLILVKKSHMLTEEIFTEMSLYWGNGEKSFSFRTSFSFYSYLKNGLSAIWECTLEKSVPRKYKMACNLIR